MDDSIHDVSSSIPSILGREEILIRERTEDGLNLRRAAGTSEERRRDERSQRMDFFLEAKLDLTDLAIVSGNL